jgi:ABC-2 type transport system permease protein
MSRLTPGLNLRRTAAVARKEFLHVLRDPQSLGMAIAIPMLMLVLFGFALTLDVDHVPLAVWDRSGSSVSREFISRFGGSRYFTVVDRVFSGEEMERAIDTREATAALVIPYDFADRVGAGRKVAVQLVLDGSDSNRASIVLAYAEAVVGGYSQEVALQTLRRVGSPPVRPPLDFRPRVWFNEDLESRNYIVPGLIAVIMMVIAALLTSLTVAREWERGTMEQLISTPVTGRELIVGKLIPYFAIGMLDVLLAVLMGQFLFGVPLRGSVVLLFVMAAIFLIGTLAMGLLISIVTKGQLVASQVAILTTFLPAFLLSGFMFQISNMPTPIQIVTYLIPARYFITLIKGIYLKGVGLETLGLEAGLLVLYAVAMVVLANAAFKKRLA